MYRMGKFIDLSGKVFGRLTVLHREQNSCDLKRAYWRCKCVCGNETIVRGDTLKSGRVKSCRCLLNETRKINGALTKKYNRYDLTNEYGVGYTLKKQVFYFDLEDYDIIKYHCWHIDKDGYLRTKIGGSLMSMHRMVYHPANNEIIDHINGNKSDNRKCNLRIATPQQNNINKRTPINNKSGYKGVIKRNQNSYQSYIGKDGKQIHIGTFLNLTDAINARIKAEENIYGEFAWKGGSNALS